ncbi:MAG: hypothetical protein RL516_198 [Bacteroidota bacterium]|jgi:hypothetical protein
MQPSAESKIKLNAAARQFNRYHPKHLQESEERIKGAGIINLLEFLDYPPLFDEDLSIKRNLENLEKLKKRMKFQKVRFNHRYLYDDICYYKLLSEYIVTIKVKEIKSIKYIQEIDFEDILTLNLNFLFNTVNAFNLIFFEAPWRRLYPILSEHLIINGIHSSYELWENLELGFKLRHGNLIIKSNRLTLNNYDEEQAIIYVDYQIKTNPKSAARWVQMKFFLLLQLDVWQIKEIQSDYFFE